MLPTMSPRPRLAASRASRQRLGEPAALVELDVDVLVASDELGQRARSMHDSSAASGSPEARPSSVASSPCGTGCSMSSTPSSASRGQESLEQGARPGLIGIDQQLRARLLLAHDAHHIEVSLGIELELQHRITRGLARLAARVGLIAETDREAGDTGRGGASPAARQARTPLCLARRSQSAQSSALRAPPGGRSRATLTG